MTMSSKAAIVAKNWTTEPSAIDYCPVSQYDYLPGTELQLI